jgi:hypothetical protein
MINCVDYYIQYDNRIEDRMFREPSNIRFLLPDNIREIKRQHNLLVDYVCQSENNNSLGQEILDKLNRCCALNEKYLDTILQSINRINDQIKKCGIPNGSVIDIPGQYQIVNDKYIDKSGDDLKRYLPYHVNIKNGDLILLCIMDYRIVMGGGLYPRKEVLFLYKTKNIKTGVINLFEATADHYRGWWKIHSSGQTKSIVDVSKYQRGRIV